MRFAPSTRGFTIVELLIVIVVVAVLAAISIVAYNGIQQRARDSKRVQDFSTIKKALLSYNTVNGGLQRPQSYGGDGPGGWDVSASSSWLAFLNSTHGAMPTDPINISDGGLPSTSDEHTYYYYCYPSGTGSYTGPTVRLGYRLETKNQLVSDFFSVDACT